MGYDRFVTSNRSLEIKLQDTIIRSIIWTWCKEWSFKAKWFETTP